MALGTSATAWAMTALAISGGCSLAASSQTSSERGQTSTPFMIRFRAARTRPVTSSRRAEAILEYKILKITQDQLFIRPSEITPELKRVELFSLETRDPSRVSWRGLQTLSDYSEVEILISLEKVPFLKHFCLKKKQLSFAWVTLLKLEPGGEFHSSEINWMRDFFGGFPNLALILLFTQVFFIYNRS